MNNWFEIVLPDSETTSSKSDQLKNFGYKIILKYKSAFYHQQLVFTQEIYEQFECTVVFSTGKRDVILLTETVTNVVLRVQWRHDSTWQGSVQKIFDFAMQHWKLSGTTAL